MKWLRSAMSMVSQEPTLFSRSIKDNIAYGFSPEPSLNEVIDAAKLTNIHGFISTLPKVCLSEFLFLFLIYLRHSTK